ncbi:hypothetical protein LY76DRAFT_27568 [Colletotrichum caudatum]|nr:hypothetical protein LY76DRAFT_27568 [Colletotrichum caudatum]
MRSQTFGALLCPFGGRTENSGNLQGIQPVTKASSETFARRFRQRPRVRRRRSIPNSTHYGLCILHESPGGKSRSSQTKLAPMILHDSNSNAVWIATQHSNFPRRIRPSHPHKLVIQTTPRGTGRRTTDGKRKVGCDLGPQNLATLPKHPKHEGKEEEAMRLTQDARVDLTF